MICKRTTYKYCIKDQVHLIENYDLAINDETQTWACHHRKETDENKTKQQLIDADLYFDRPAEELIFLTPEEHSSIHHKGKTRSDKTKQKMSEAQKGKTFSDEAKQKMSEAQKGKHHNDETKQKMSESHKGKHHNDETRKKMSEAHKGKTFSDEAKQKMSEAKQGKQLKKCRWLTPDCQIIEMDISHAKRYHPDWAIIINE